MNKSKHDTPWTLDWQDLCMQINRYEGTEYTTQKRTLNYLYKMHGGSIKKMADHIGVCYPSLTRKLVLEGIHEKKTYKRGKRKIGESRQIIRDKPDDFFIDMDCHELIKLFPNNNISSITRLMRAENKLYKKKWYWAKYGEDKYYKKRGY